MPRNAFDIPDSREISHLYADDPRQVDNLSPKKFVENIAWRLYTEFCCDRRNSWSSHRDYDGQAYRQWVADEIHFEIERRLKPLSPEEQSQINHDQLYAEVRIDVLRAVTTRAVELFSDWKGETYPPDAFEKGDDVKHDTKNLRTSLEPYLARSA